MIVCITWQRGNLKSKEDAEKAAEQIKNSCGTVTVIVVADDVKIDFVAGDQ